MNVTQYSILNITGWDDYPEGCWLFPLPAINVQIDGIVYLLATETAADDTSAGVNVAAAWCEKNGFDGVGETRKADFSEGQTVRSIQIATGETCEGMGLPNGQGAPCTAFQYIECIKGAATSGCSRRFTSANFGDNNMGYGNNLGWSVSGSDNVGNFNNGSTNLGDYNLGSANRGSFNQGSANYGNCNMGSAMKGDFVECPGAELY
ncbi:hypothetical protein N2152v2_009318 [Parachlorella kessleri]